MQQGPATAPKNEPWTYEENEILLVRMRDSHCLDSRGRPKWDLVAEGLPGRTAQEARCRWRRMNDAKKRRKGGETFRNKCSTCGQPRRGHICPGVNSAALAPSPFAPTAITTTALTSSSIAAAAIAAAAISVAASAVAQPAAAVAQPAAAITQAPTAIAVAATALA